jgi:hypothetical protein
MKRFSFALLASAVSFIIVGTVAAAPPLQAFGTGDVTVDGDSVTIVNDAGEYGGVYVKAKSLGNKPLADVVVSFTSTGDVTGGAPRFNIPIDSDGDRMIDYYATLDAANCGGTSGSEVWVSTENSVCAVYFLDAAGTGPMPASASYANWDAYVAANPTHRVASKGDGSTPFIVADVGPGTYVVEDVDLQ